MGDLNIDCHNINDTGYDVLDRFCDIFNFNNLIKEKTCFASSSGTSIDVFLTNKPRSFQNTVVCETGLSDHHKMIATFLRSHLVRLKPKRIFFRSYKLFNETYFLSDVENENFEDENDDPDQKYQNLVNKFSSIINKHAPLKQKILRGNEAPFMTKELKKSNLH